jgi:hypothetical protein
MLGQAGCPVRLGPAETREGGLAEGGEVMSLSLSTEDQRSGFWARPVPAGIEGRQAPRRSQEERHSSPASQRGIPALTFHATQKLAGQALDESPLRYRPLAIETDRGSPLGCT